MSPTTPGVSDHAGRAILVTVLADDTDRREAPLVADGLPSMPHRHEGQKLQVTAFG